MTNSQQKLDLISAVLQAVADADNFSLSAATRRLFALVESGESDFEVLKSAALNEGDAR